MRIVVTGAGGFVGSRLVPHLGTAGHDVVTLPRDALATPARHIEGADAVIHLAAIAHTAGASAEAYRRVNAELPVRLGEVAAASGVRRFVFVSSSQAGTHPHTPYGGAKLSAERGLLALEGIEAVVVRPPLVYGPGARANFGALVRLARLPVPLPFGSGSGRRSLIALDNLADALAFAANREGLSGTVWAATDPGPPPTVAEIIALLRAGMGRQPGLVPAPWLPTVLRALGRSRLAERLFEDAVVEGSTLADAGWVAPVSPAEALRRTGAATVAAG